MDQRYRNTSETDFDIQHWGSETSISNGAPPVDSLGMFGRGRGLVKPGITERIFFDQNPV
jgi:hypothetical protein